ncbi:MAG TPA: hypothetical protein VKI44_09925 [Acetobacteraceae bacterium]|nr:hypothetical protein [Acetobacteraceae bacterium]
MKRGAELARPAFAAAILLALTPGMAAAYIGPGGGLTLLSTALAMLAAFSVSAVVVVTWPLRAMKRWLQRRRAKQKAAGSGRAAEHSAEQQ